MRNGLHVYTKVSIAAASLNAFGNATLFCLLFVSPGIFVLVVHDNIFFTGFLCMAAAGPGLHGLVKYFWPGDTAYERARKPSGKDVAVILAALVLALLNGAALAAQLAIVGGALAAD